MKLGLRDLPRNPAFAVTAIFSLALGIGAARGNVLGLVMREVLILAASGWLSA